MTNPNQSNQFNQPAPPEQPTPASTARIHQVDDVDTSPTAHHHTLGYSNTQAAPGHHNHGGTDGSAVLGDYAPVAHDHTQGDVDSLISDLAGKASTVHLHDFDDINGTPAAVSGSRANPEEALKNLLTALNTLGIITDTTTA